MAEAELVSRTSPPLQPDQPIGEIAAAQQQAQRTGAYRQSPSIEGGTNPDDVTR